MMSNSPQTDTVQIIGNTYRCRDLIKRRGGRWDTATKTWIIAAAEWDKLASLDHGSAVAGCHILGTPVPVRQASAVRVNQPCRRCGTYCYGDCES